MFITGSSADGSDAMLVEGLYFNKDRTEWSNKPIQRHDVAYHKVYQHCARHKKSFESLYRCVKSGSRENLPKWVREWFVAEYEAQNLEEVKVDLKEII